MTKKINLKTDSWCVKNDGSQLFKDTVVKWMRKGGMEYTGSEIDYYYGFTGKCNDVHSIPFGTLLSITEFIDLVKSEEVNLIDHLANAISKSGAKIQFGLEAQGHIPHIEKTLSENGFTYHTWQEIAKHIGWDALTTVCYYQSYRDKQERAKQEEDRVKMLEWVLNHPSIVHGHDGNTSFWWDAETDGTLTSTQLITKYEEYKASLTEKM